HTFHPWGPCQPASLTSAITACWCFSSSPASVKRSTRSVPSDCSTRNSNTPSVAARDSQRRYCPPFTNQQNTSAPLQQLSPGVRKRRRHQRFIWPRIVSRRRLAFNGEQDLMKLPSHPLLVRTVSQLAE